MVRLRQLAQMVRSRLGTRTVRSDSKVRLTPNSTPWTNDSILHEAFDNIGGPVVSTAYNHTGTIFAYAVAYDWSKGYTGMASGMMNKVFLHACKDEEVKKRPKVTTSK